MTRRRVFAAIALIAAVVGAAQLWAWHHLRAARAALVAHRPDEARASLASCAHVWGRSPEVHLLAARAARQADDTDAAERELRACQRISGATDDTAFEWALGQAAAGNVREVESFLQKRADKSATDGPLVWEALTQGYLRVYRTLDAMSVVKHWLSLDPDNVRALDLRGQVYVTGKGVVRGVEDYRRVLELDPTRRDTRWRLAGSLIDLGGYDEAAGHLEEYAKAAPADPQVAARLARCYVMTKRGADARRLLDAALVAHPDHALCLRARGQVALTTEPPDLAAAEEFLRRAAAAAPDDYQAAWSYAEALRQRGKGTEAKAELTRAEGVRDRLERLGELRSRKLAEYPLDPALHFEMGALLLAGNPDVAAQWLASAVQLDPDHRPAHAALADYYTRKGDAPLAAEHRRRAAGEGK